MHAPGGWGVRSLGVDFDVFKYLNPPTGTYTTTVTRVIHTVMACLIDEEKWPLKSIAGKR
jgi:hypothetical protein